jgi:predicted amidohydrolase
VFGVMICRDSTFAELARSMVARGATALFIPTNNALTPTKGGADVVEHARRTDVGLANENCVSVIRADVAGRTDGLKSYGSSGIVAPDGLAFRSDKQREPDLLIAEIEIPTGRNRSNIQMVPTRAGS